MILLILKLKVSSVLTDQMLDEEIVAMVWKRRTKGDQIDVYESDDGSDDNNDNLTVTPQDAIQ
ncbi:hypothetical protein AX14_006552, partial [Amanita brunnescens Koide BX004]